MPEMRCWSNCCLIWFCRHVFCLITSMNRTIAPGAKSDFAAEYDLGDVLGRSVFGSRCCLIFQRGFLCGKDLHKEE